MILPNAERFMMTTDDDAEIINFKINANAKMFRMLSDGVYTDKISAIIRELSCNARDSHTSAGIAETPIRIQIPTELDPTFEVEDFGVGLSYEECVNIYTVYGESTKTGTNDLTGALGIGSKSPYCYTDSFEIISKKDGVCNHYIATKNIRQEPELQKISEYKTSDGNGVKIRISVNPDDIYVFRRKAHAIFAVFDVMPSGFEFDKVKYDITPFGENIVNSGVVSINNGRNLYTSSFYAVMANVAYSFDLNFTRMHELLHGIESGPDINAVETYLKFNARSNTTFFYFENGMLDFAISREALSLDPRTEKNLYLGIFKKTKTIIEQHKEKVKQCSDLFELNNYFMQHKTENMYIPYTEMAFYGVGNGDLTFKRFDVPVTTTDDDDNPVNAFTVNVGIRKDRYGGSFTYTHSLDVCIFELNNEFYNKYKISSLKQDIDYSIEAEYVYYKINRTTPIVIVYGTDVRKTGYHKHSKAIINNLQKNRKTLVNYKLPDICEIVAPSISNKLFESVSVAENITYTSNILFADMDLTEEQKQEISDYTFGCVVFLDYKKARSVINPELGKKKEEKEVKPKEPRKPRVVHKETEIKTRYFDISSNKLVTDSQTTLDLEPYVTANKNIVTILPSQSPIMSNKFLLDYCLRVGIDLIIVDYAKNEKKTKSLNILKFNDFVFNNFKPTLLEEMFIRHSLYVSDSRDLMIKFLVENNLFVNTDDDFLKRMFSLAECYEFARDSIIKKIFDDRTYNRITNEMKDFAYNGINFSHRNPSDAHDELVRISHMDVELDKELDNIFDTYPLIRASRFSGDTIKNSPVLTEAIKEYLQFKKNTI